MWGWVRGFKDGRGWNGCLTLPRILTIAPEGHLLQSPAPELQSLRGRKVNYTDLALDNKSRLLEDIKGDTLEIKCKFKAEGARSFGLQLRCSSDGSRGVALRFEADKLDVAGIKVPVKLDQVDRVLDLHVFLDKTVLEVFINNGRAYVTRVVYSDEEDLGLKLFAQEGKARVVSLEAWEMQSIW